MARSRSRQVEGPPSTPLYSSSLPLMKEGLNGHGLSSGAFGQVLRKTTSPVTRRVTRSQSRELGHRRRPLLDDEDDADHHLDNDDDDVAATSGKKGHATALAVVVEESPQKSSPLKPMASRPETQNQVIPETPDDEINISGTTILPSEPDLDLDPGKMIEAFPKLWDAAEDMLEFSVPSPFELLEFTKLLQKLNDPQSLESWRLARQTSNLREEARYFGSQPYIDVELVDDIFKSSATVAEKLHELEGQWDPAPALQKANCARFVLEVLLCEPESTSSLKQAIRILDSIFPLPFTTRLVPAGQRRSAGDSLLEKETFDLALELRTQYTIMQLEEKYQNDPDFEPSRVLEEGFCIELANEEGLVLRGFETEALRGPNGEIPPGLAAEVAYRYQEMEALCLVEDIIDIEGLKKNYGWRKFVLRAAQWVCKRTDEINADMRRPLQTYKDVKKAFFARPKTRYSLGSTFSSTPRMRNSGTPSTARHPTQSIPGTATTSRYAVVTPSLARNGSRNIPGSVVSARSTRYSATPSSLRNEYHTIPETQPVGRNPHWESGESASPEARRSMQLESPVRPSARSLQRTTGSPVEHDLSRTLVSPEVQRQLQPELPTPRSGSMEQAEGVNGSDTLRVEQQARAPERATPNPAEPARSSTRAEPAPVTTRPEKSVSDTVETTRASNNIPPNSFKKPPSVDGERRKSLKSKPVFLNATAMDRLRQRELQLSAAPKNPGTPRQTEPLQPTNRSARQQFTSEKSSENRQVERPRANTREPAPEEPSEIPASPDMTSTFVQDEVEIEVTDGQLDIGEHGESQLERSHSPSFVRSSRPSSLREEALQQSRHGQGKDTNNDVSQVSNVSHEEIPRSGAAPRDSRVMFIDRQTNAARVSPISQGLDPRSVERRRNETSRKRGREPDEIPESDAEFEHDDREVSVERQRARKPIQPRSKRARRENQTENATERSSNRAQEIHSSPLRRSTRSAQSVSPHPPSASAPSTQKNKPGRRPTVRWEPGQSKRLKRLIDEHGQDCLRGTHFDWKKIRKHDAIEPLQPGEKRFTDKDEGQVKDRARNIKNYHIKNGIPLPPGWEGVTASASIFDQRKQP
ncbi:uncharacterized protein BO72DRAFT_530534 [Aspergillus fijiensis CBS 313.89]|uniref:Myb-like domain-containing protein n=1 Tax=Aspergillus fijiensis CBS 313.89 TaxID=1448319 RepID=A0A8G1RKU9_9EURO|nr:uncharacterized protein BO72DRAFT_530534 [Aspergillus fijiensis CBS 313.89]RAK74003.1 hypothetical protein BO72DRAFT_530534 [Aspergillus fijiensis CBS 313.89]